MSTVSPYFRPKSFDFSLNFSSKFEWFLLYTIISFVWYLYRFRTPPPFSNIEFKCLLLDCQLSVNVIFVGKGGMGVLTKLPVEFLITGDTLISKIMPIPV